MSTVQTDLLHHVRTGPRGRPPVLLLHPAGLDLTYWADQLRALRDVHDVIAPDLPGHGGSGLGAARWTFALVSEDLLTLLDGVGAQAAHLVGISVGGMIAQEFALAHPERVASLALIATASEFPDDARAGMRERAQRLRASGMASVVDETIKRWFTPQTVSDRPDLVDRVTKTLGRDDAEAHAQLWEAVATLDTTARLDAIGCPTLILGGEVDPSCPPPAVRLLNRSISDSRLIMLPDTSHMAILERPEFVGAAFERPRPDFPRVRRAR